MKGAPSPKIENRFVESFPGDLSGERASRKTPGVAYSRVDPSPVLAPRLITWSEDLAQSLGIGPAEKLLPMLAGNEVLPAMKPYAARYGGHQFGHWAGQLGDGRAITLGEWVSPTHETWEIQLKGAGPTPYSRKADGRAVLRSSLREYLCSEAMHHLGVPTTRALACVITGDLVVRDLFYDGHPRPEPGAITTRVAPSFLRFGNFEILAAEGELDLLRNLVRYTIDRFYPQFSGSHEESIAQWFGEVCQRTAHLMVEWMRVGFVHGVMNTDNMSILGLTIDYGPYGWLDVYDPNWTPNTTDSRERRYRFGYQPQIALWNLSCLAESLTSLVPSTALLEQGLELYKSTFQDKAQMMLARKLGLSQDPNPAHLALFQELDQVLQLTETDMTLFYRLLANGLRDPNGSVRAFMEHLSEAFYSPLTNENAKRFEQWLGMYLEQIEIAKTPRHDIARKMDAVNPVLIPRNYLVHMALEELTSGESPLLRQLETALKTPYELNSATRPFFKRRPDWARSTPGCSALSCSS